MSEPFESSKESVEETLKERRAVQMLRTFMRRSSEYREPFLELARKSREIYETWQPTSRSIIQRANLKLPFGFTIVETQVPQLMDIFFQGGAPAFRWKGKGPEDAVWEDTISDFHIHQLEEMGFEPKAAAFFKAMLLDGTAIGKVPYLYREQDIIVRDSEINPITGEMERIKRAKTEIVVSRPDFEVVPIYDFFPDWSVKSPGNIKAMRGCVHRMYKTLAALKSSRLYKNLDEIDLSIGKKGTNAWSQPYYSEDDFKDDFERLQDQKEPGIKDSGRIELWEYWGLWDTTGNGDFEEYLITVANGDVIIRMENNPYDYKFKPFVACPNYIRETEFYGIPELTPVRPLIKEANTLRNARLDNVNLSVNPMWVADRAAGINSKSLYSRANGIIWTNDINGIKPITLPDPTNGSANELISIQQDIQNATATVNAAPIASTLGKQFGRSATGVNFIQSFSSSRLGLKGRLASELFFKPMADIMLLTNRQFVDENTWVKVMDPNTPDPFKQLPPDAFYRKYDFAPNTALDGGGLDGQFQKMQTVAQIAQVFENSQPGTFKADILLESLLRPLLGRQVKRFVRSDQERSDLQAQQLASQQAINAAQGQAAPQPNAATPQIGAALEPILQGAQS